MFVDKNISNKNIIIKQVDIKESFEPDFEKLDNLEKRYNIWRNIYSTNKKININY